MEGQAILDLAILGLEEGSFRKLVMTMAAVAMITTEGHRIKASLGAMALEVATMVGLEVATTVDLGVVTTVGLATTMVDLTEVA